MRKFRPRAPNSERFNTVRYNATWKFVLLGIGKLVPWTGTWSRPQRFGSIRQKSIRVLPGRPRVKITDYSYIISYICVCVCMHIQPRHDRSCFKIAKWKHSDRLQSPSRRPSFPFFVCPHAPIVWSANLRARFRTGLYRTVKKIYTYLY